MIHEKSCGAVIFYQQGSQRLYLLEHMVKGHVSLCKGHMEGQETEHETAIREIREETGLTVRFVDGFRESIRYSPYPGCTKQVIFFLAEADSMSVTAQPEEVQSIEWLPFNQACLQLTHDSDCNILCKAEQAMMDADE